jgi:hypothetical protein
MGCLLSNACPSSHRVDNCRSLSLASAFSLTWFKDLDGSSVGQAVVDGLTTPGLPSEIDWAVLQAEQFPDGVVSVSHAVAEHETWVAVTGASNPLQAILT